MKFFSYIAVAVLSMLLLGITVQTRFCVLGNKDQAQALTNTQSTFSTSLRLYEKELAAQLVAFGNNISENRSFAMAFLVQKDLSALEITEAAYTPMKLMGLDFLDILLPTGRLISCGHQPDLYGSNDLDAMNIELNGVTFRERIIRNHKMLTLEMRYNLLCGDKELNIVGGIIVDSNFIKTLLPAEDECFLIFYGKDIILDKDITTMSGIVDNQMLLNDTAWSVASVVLKWNGSGKNPTGIVIKKIPVCKTLMDLF